MIYSSDNWKYIKGTDRRYKLYYDGRIWIVGKKRFSIPYEDEKGYLRVYVAGKQKRIHVLVAEHFHKIPKHLKKFKRSQLEVNHKDLDRANPHGDNLEWMTHTDNLLHRGMGKKRGVITRLGRYIATITIKGKTEHLGSFGDKEKAYEAYRTRYIKEYNKEPW